MALVTGGPGVNVAMSQHMSHVMCFFYKAYKELKRKSITQKMTLKICLVQPKIKQAEK